MVMSAEQLSKFVSLHWLWSQYEWKILKWDDKPQTNKKQQF